MQKRVLPMLVCLLFLLAGCAGKETVDARLEQIRSSPAVRLESAEPGTETFLVDSVTLSLSGLADLRIVQQEGEFTDTWRYRFTYDPAEKVPKGEELVVLFGDSCLSVGGVVYVPEAGVDYADILAWAQGKYDYLAGSG